MESVKLSSVNYFWQIHDGDIQDDVPLLSKHHCVRVVTFDQPLYSKATEKILDSPPFSLLETIVQVVGGFHKFVNLLLSDWYNGGSHLTKLAFKAYYLKEDILII